MASAPASRGPLEAPRRVAGAELEGAGGGVAWWPAEAAGEGSLLFVARDELVEHGAVGIREGLSRPAARIARLAWFEPVWHESFDPFSFAVFLAVLNNRRFLWISLAFLLHKL